MKKLLVILVMAVGCDMPTAKVGKATNCVRLSTPEDCPTVFRITDPDTGAALYITTHGGLTILPKSEIQAEKPLPK